MVSRFYRAVVSHPRFTDKLLSFILLGLILGALGMFGYSVATPDVGEKFTEFYILGATNKAGSYPKQLAIGKEAKLIAGIINRESGTMSYRIELTIDGRKIKDIGPIVVERGQKWENEISFTPDEVGSNQKLQLSLYKGSQFYTQLVLWVNVAEQEERKIL